MLWYYDKKINAAFERLRARRRAVGTESVAETPEQEAKRVSDEMAHAAATGDISKIIGLVTQCSALTPADFISKTVGGILFLYYMFIDKLHVRPTDLDDMIDGLLYLDAKDYIMKQSLNKGK